VTRTRWPRRLPPAPIEPPEWVRVFHPDDWRDLEDEAEWRRANRGLEEACPGRLQLDLDWRARVRWCQAVNDWYREHPGADRRFEDLLQRRRRRRQGGSGVDVDQVDAP
jgi:hypothetical protein